MKKDGLIHTSRITIFKDEGPVRRGYIEGFREPVYYGVHTNIKDFYGLEPEVEYPATLDHIISATGAWLTGTFGAALEVRQVKSAPDRLYSEVEGDIESVSGVLRITKIRVRYHLRHPPEVAEKVERAFQFHPQKCPAYMTLKDVVDITLSLEIEET